MKARTNIVRQSDIKKEVAKEMQKRYSELQGEIMQDITELNITVTF